MASSSFLSSGRVFASLALVAAVFALTVVAAPGCSNAASNAGPSCDDSKCAAGNKCLPLVTELGTETKCRKTCSSNVDSSASCPFGYTCVQSDPALPSFCIQDKTGLTAPADGQYGFGCAGGPSINNAKCAAGFVCHGTGPSDATAYCTTVGCTTDRDCGATFYCGDSNVVPNVDTTCTFDQCGSDPLCTGKGACKAAVTGPRAQKVCLKRVYCSPCTADLDCPPLNGKTQHCINGVDNVGFCAPECDTTDGCNNEARCAAVNGVKVCYPRAQQCVADGSLCAPCRADSDCGTDGVCVKGEYTTEHSCAKKSKIACSGKGNTQGVDQDCPAKWPTSQAPIGCSSAGSAQVPQQYCYGVYPFGSGGDVGCFSPSR